MFERNSVLLLFSSEEIAEKSTFVQVLQEEAKINRGIIVFSSLYDGREDSERQ